MKKNLRSSFTSLKSWVYLHLVLMLASICLSFVGSIEMDKDILQGGAVLGGLAFLLYLLYLNSLIKLFDSILKTSVFDDLKNDD
mgnify:CR=1 FL=1|tara:strand:- start:316 stop:567 length:252 start_codon:yes stop_codon:yes gene_type:complete